MAKSGYLPQIYAEGGYLRQSETDLAQADNWGVSVNLDWPLFEGGKTDAEVVKANVEKQRLENLRRDLAAAIRNEVQSGQRLVQQRQSLVEAYLLNLQAEERGYRDTLARQEQGEVMVADLQEQKARLLMAQANYLESVNQLRIAIAALEAAAATSLEALLSTGEIYRSALPLSEQPPVEAETSGQAATDSAMPMASPASPPPAVEQLLPVTTETTLPESDNSSSTIQLGAFKSKKMAQALLKSLEKKYPDKAFKVVSTGGWHKVRVAQPNSRSAAEALLQELGGKGLIVRLTGPH